MTEIIADLQVHSRFSRAVSKEMTLPNIAAWASKKGIGLVATGDWTHPQWFREIERDLEETGNGFFKLKSQNSKVKSSIQNSKLQEPDICQSDPLFLLATEISSIYSQDGKGRRVHTLVWVSSLESARKISQEMTRRGCNLLSDGRPITNLSVQAVAEIALTVDPKSLVIPAHAWTPWFSLYGSMSGFDSLEQAFGPYAKYIYAIETGLSSSPDMNWRIKELDSRKILSFSDAHSGVKLGREATVFETAGDTPFSYDLLSDAITTPPTKEIRHRQSAIAYTIEFFPEEGKYHYSGHRACNIRITPGDSSVNCPVCGKRLTQGVMARVEQLAGRTDMELAIFNEPVKLPGGEGEIILTRSRLFPERTPFVSLVPLTEIISESIGSPVSSPKVERLYEPLVRQLGGEFNVLLKAGKEKISAIAGTVVAEGITKVRNRDIVVEPGYDGVFGVVKIWKRDGATPFIDSSKEQLKIF
jgi:PHP family Zn ribbon phosphoesterase